MTTTVAPIEDRRSLGIGLLVFAQLLFAGLDTSAKWLAVSGIPTGEIVFMRYAVHVALILALIMPVRGLALFRTGNWKLEVLRGLCLLGVTVGNFLAMQFLPLTVTGALLFTMPLFVCALSIPMLGETVGWRRWLAIVAGFIGVLIIVRPGTAAFHPAALLCIGGALCAAVYAILTRKLSGVDTAATQQVYAGIIALVCVAPFAFTGWVWPQSGPDWFAFFAAGVFGVCAHGLNTTAIRFAPPSLLAPFRYIELLYLAVASWGVFAEPPDVWFYIGAPIIILSGLYIWLRERALRKPTTVLATAED
jgi:drug/metabolite transporter (DMT)-like permease